MNLYKFNKVVVSFSNNAQQFLNGLTSNAMDKPSNAFLNIHGKIVATFDQIKLNDNEFLLLFEKEYVDDVLNHLDRYLKLNNILVRQLPHIVYFDLHNEYSCKPDEYQIIQETGKLILTPHELKSNVSEEEFTLFRLKNNIPLHGRDYKNELLLNVSDHKFVSFTKGCYLGQEPISKVHSRSKPTWKLVVRYADELVDEEKDKMTSRMKDDTGRVMGFAFVKNV